jgi:hypothetical protein
MRFVASSEQDSTFFVNYQDIVEIQKIKFINPLAFADDDLQYQQDYMWLLMIQIDLSAVNGISAIFNAKDPRTETYA